MKTYRYYITDLDAGSILGTDSKEVSEALAQYEDNFVIDTATGEWLHATGKRVAVRELTLSVAAPTAQDGRTIVPGGYASWEHLARALQGEVDRLTACVNAGASPVDQPVTNASQTAWHNDRADALREVLKEIADLKSLTATPEQFYHHLQRLACRALTADAMAEPKIEA